MRFPHFYPVAFSIMLLPILGWLGADSVHQKSVHSCEQCQSKRSFGELSWFFWGVSGQRVLEDRIEASRLMQDFPELSCDHAWGRASVTQEQVWDSPLWVVFPPLVPAGGVSIDCCFGWSSFTPDPLWYNENPGFRDLVDEAMSDGIATRGEVASWLARGGVVLAAEDSGDNDQAFALLDERLRRFRPRLELPAAALPMTAPAGPQMPPP